MREVGTPGILDPPECRFRGPRQHCQFLQSRQGEWVTIHSTDVDVDLTCVVRHDDVSGFYGVHGGAYASECSRILPGHFRRVDLHRYPQPVFAMSMAPRWLRRHGPFDDPVRRPAITFLNSKALQVVACESVLVCHRLDGVRYDRVSIFPQSNPVLVFQALGRLDEISQIWLPRSRTFRSRVTPGPERNQELELDGDGEVFWLVYCFMVLKDSLFVRHFLYC